MSRTESISIQVHPADEQSQIDLMQRFHWSLLSTQDIKTVDNHLERRGDSIYSVTNTEHYVKLAFHRSLDLPHLQEIKNLEREFFSLPRPDYPALFPFHIIAWIVAAFVYGLGIVAWVAYFFLYYKPKTVEADAILQHTRTEQDRILRAVASLDAQSASVA
jgi:hypothetical protein